MIKQNRLLSLCLYACAALIIGCGDEHLVNEKEGMLGQYVYVTPDGYVGNVAELYTPIGENLYVEKGQTVKFHAGHSLKGYVYTDETLSDYYGGVSWTIGEDDFNLNSFRYTFNTAGKIDGTLETFDFYGDTLRTHFTIYVNTPNSISLTFPYDGYNQVNATEITQFPLQWDISGLDEWESAKCLIYLSYDRDSIWNNLLDSSDCFSKTTLNGTLPYNEDSQTLYWAVQLISLSNGGAEYIDSSEVFHFSTKILSDSSTVRIPVALEGFRETDNAELLVELISANGDTLKKIETQNVRETISAKVSAQSRLKILVSETRHTEFAPESVIVDIPEQTVVTLDTIILTDNVAPQIQPLQEIFGITTGVEFQVYDNGVGINASKLTVVVGRDTVESSYESPTLYFKPVCKPSCKVQIMGEDYAHNKLPDVYWSIDNISNVYSVSGPYANGGL